MLKIIFIFFIREKRNLMINRWTIPTRLALALIDLTIYYYAAKAFIPDSGTFKHLGKWSLFEFVSIGELVLFLALDSLVIYPQQLRRVIGEGVFECLLLTKTSLIKCLTLLGLSSYLLSIMTILFQIFCLVFIFNISYQPTSVFKVVFLNIASLPFFISIGLLSSSIMLLLRRGVGLFSTLVSSLGVLSGAYFPTSVFPEWFSKIISKVNPLSFLLNESRALLKENASKELYLTLFFLVTLSTIFFLLSNFITNLAVQNYRRRGEKLLLGN